MSKIEKNRKSLQWLLWLFVLFLYSPNHAMAQTQDLLLSPSQPVRKERQAQVLYWKQVQDNIATTLDSIKKNFLFDRDTPDATRLDSALVFSVAKKKDIAQSIYDIKMARSTGVSSPRQTEAAEDSLVMEGLLEPDSTANRMKGLVGISRQLVRGS